MNYLTELYNVVAARKGADPKTSYTATLFQKGTHKIAQKVGEEAVEIVIEALRGDREKLVEESADFLYHLLVLWADQDVTPDDVARILQHRNQPSSRGERETYRQE